MDKLVVANFKMNGSKDFYKATIKTLCKEKLLDTKLILCPPFVYLPYIKIRKNDAISLGSQNIASQIDGKSTGETSPEMLKAFDVKYTIIGHSERRALGETDDLIANKVKLCLDNNIIPIICVGEEKKTKTSFDMIIRQVKTALLYIKDKDYVPLFAYEPLFSIGSGKVCDNDHINKAVNLIERTALESGFKTKILYGGSVNETNYKSILKECNISGLLIGGLSLKVDKFRELLKGINNG